MSDITRRKHPRAAFQTPVGVTCQEFSELTQGIEIGEGGLAFATTSNLEPGRNVVLNFYLGPGLFYSIRSVVRNKSQSTEPGLMIYGVSFQDVPIALKRQIRSFVARASHNLRSNRAMSGF